MIFFYRRDRRARRIKIKKGNIKLSDLCELCGKFFFIGFKNRGV